jgi:hypothetical protein
MEYNPDECHWGLKIKISIWKDHFFEKLEIREKQLYWFDEMNDKCMSFQKRQKIIFRYLSIFRDEEVLKYILGVEFPPPLESYSQGALIIKYEAT